jgi:hypothetical protein
MSRARQNETAARRAVQLRRVARHMSPAGRAELGDVIEGLEEDVEDAVGKASAARILGVSTTTIDKWVEKGLLTAVPAKTHGRTAIAKAQLLDVAEQVAELREIGRTRGLLDEVLSRLEFEDATGWSVEQLQKAAARPFNRDGYVSTMPKPDWGPND